jgi:hypothetical protein
LIASGMLLRRSGGGVGSLRHSPAARSVLKLTALLTVASAVLAVLLGSLGKDDATVSGHRSAATPAPANKPKAPAAKSAKPARPSKPAAAGPAPAVPAPPRHHRAKPADPTAGLVRVPPPHKKAPSGTNGNGSTSGTGSTSGPTH